MSAESLDKEARAALTGGAIGSFVTACLCVCLWAISQSKSYQPETVAPGTTLMHGCPETVIVTLKKGDTLMSYTESNVAEGFQLKAVQGQHWTIKLKKPEGQ